jgi:hypothetical protein
MLGNKYQPPTVGKSKSASTCASIAQTEKIKSYKDSKNNEKKKS